MDFHLFIFIVAQNKFPPLQYILWYFNMTVDSTSFWDFLACFDDVCIGSVQLIGLDVI